MQESITDAGVLWIVESRVNICTLYFRSFARPIDIMKWLRRHNIGEHPFAEHIENNDPRIANCVWKYQILKQGGTPLFIILTDGIIIPMKMLIFDAIIMWISSKFACFIEVFRLNRASMTTVAFTVLEAISGNYGHVEELIRVMSEVEKIHFLFVMVLCSNQHICTLTIQEISSNSFKSRLFKYMLFTTVMLNNVPIFQLLLDAMDCQSDDIQFVFEFAIRLKRFEIINIIKDMDQIRNVKCTVNLVDEILSMHENASELTNRLLTSLEIPDEHILKYAEDSARKKGCTKAIPILQERMECIRQQKRRPGGDEDDCESVASSTGRENIGGSDRAPCHEEYYPYPDQQSIITSPV